VVNRNVDKRDDPSSSIMFSCYFVNLSKLDFLDLKFRIFGIAILGNFTVLENLAKFLEF